MDYEFEIKELRQRVSNLEKVVTEQVIKPKKNTFSTNSPHYEFPHTCGDILMREPIMYFYNMSGISQQITVDFKDNIIPDSVPKVRVDNKLIFTLDADSYINSKYDFLFYEFEIKADLPKSSCIACVRNDKNLYDDLIKLGTLCHLEGKECTDFATYAHINLKRNDTKYYKVEIYDEAKLDKLFPMDIYPKPDYFIRRYFSFTPSDKLVKSNLDRMREIWQNRKGATRCIEFGYTIAGSTKIN